MCDCLTPVIHFGGNTSHSQVEPCSQITTDTLMLYRMMVQCVQSKESYAPIGSNLKECSAAATVLENWMAAKAAGDDGCVYYQHMPVLQELIKRIILSGICS